MNKLLAEVVSIMKSSKKREKRLQLQLPGGIAKYFKRSIGKSTTN
jgi:hypothetical protein